MARLAAFDMDDTLLDGRLVFALAEGFGLKAVSGQSKQTAGLQILKGQRR